jgi:hypothetical protein
MDTCIYIPWRRSFALRPSQRSTAGQRVGQWATSHQPINSMNKKRGNSSRIARLPNRDLPACQPARPCKASPCHKRYENPEPWRRCKLVTAAQVNETVAIGHWRAQWCCFCEILLLEAMSLFLCSNTSISLPFTFSHCVSPLLGGDQKQIR